MPARSSGVMGGPPQVLEIGPPGRETIFRDAISGSPAAAEWPCCPCPGQQGGYPYGPQEPGRPPIDQMGPGGLGQPPSYQPPFQPVPQDPCDYTREMLKGFGLTPEMIDDCLKQGGRQQRRAPRRASQRRGPTSLTQRMSELQSRYPGLTRSEAGQLARRELGLPARKRKGRRSSKEVAAARRRSQQTAPRVASSAKYRWYPGPGERGMCRDMTSNKIVKRSRCGR